VRFLDGSGEAIDAGLALFFPAPHSYTGEHVLELHGHGGPWVMEALIARALELGARRALPGEFTQRAFLNDKLDLAQAEAVADLIDAGSREAAHAAMRSLQGEFSAMVRGLTEAVIELRTYVEAAIAGEEVDYLPTRVNERLRAPRHFEGALRRAGPVARGHDWSPPGAQCGQVEPQEPTGRLRRGDRARSRHHDVVRGASTSTVRPHVLDTPACVPVATLPVEGIWRAQDAARRPRAVRHRRGGRSGGCLRQGARLLAVVTLVFNKCDLPSAGRSPTRERPLRLMFRAQRRRCRLRAPEAGCGVTAARRAR
jgi:hypothetical protein